MTRAARRRGANGQPTARTTARFSWTRSDSSSCSVCTNWTRGLAAGSWQLEARGVTLARTSGAASCQSRHPCRRGRPGHMHIMPTKRPSIVQAPGSALLKRAPRNRWDSRPHNLMLMAVCGARPAGFGDLSHVTCRLSPVPVTTRNRHAARSRIPSSQASAHQVSEGFELSSRPQAS